MHYQDKFESDYMNINHDHILEWIWNKRNRQFCAKYMKGKANQEALKNLNIIKTTFYSRGKSFI